jgi:hypothetical protein
MVVQIDRRDWSLGESIGPPLTRPIDVGHSPNDGRLHILDFGEFEITPAGIASRAETGKLWSLPASET